MKIDPFSKRIITPGSYASKVMLQLRVACAASFALENVKLKTEQLSTGVIGVMTMFPVIFVGAESSLEGFSKRARIAQKRG